MFESSHSASAGAPEPGSTEPVFAGRSSGAGADDMDALLDHIVRSTHEVVDRLAERAVPVLRRVSSQPQDAVDYLGDGADVLGAGLENWFRQYRHVVRDHPVAIVAAAVAAGVLINRIRAR